jgi:hypothetical protein
MVYAHIIEEYAINDGKKKKKRKKIEMRFDLLPIVCTIVKMSLLMLCWYATLLR